MNPVKYPLFFLIALAVMSGGCKVKEREVPKPSKKEPISKTLIGTWQLYDQVEESNTANDNEDKLLKAARAKQGMVDGTVVSFFTDGKYTEVKGTGEYKTGSWKYIDNRKTVLIKDSSGQQTAVTNLEELNDEPALTMLFPATHVRMKFLKYGEGLKDLTEDPFYPASNNWRIKPLHEENDAQLHARLANYFQHLLYLLKSSQEREKDRITFAFSQGIVKIYNGGIGINEESIVPASWKDTYYDYYQVLTAYLMFGKYLKESHYRGAGTGNWIEDDYNILLSIYADVKENKFPLRTQLRQDVKEKKGRAAAEN